MSPRTDLAQYCAGRSSDVYTPRTAAEKAQQLTEARVTREGFGYRDTLFLDSAYLVAQASTPDRFDGERYACHTSQRIRAMWDRLTR